MIDDKLHEILYRPKWGDKKHVINEIKQVILDAIEDMDFYSTVDEGEDDYGRTQIREMGDAVLVEDINTLLGEK